MPIDPFVGRAGHRRLRVLTLVSVAIGGAGGDEALAVATRLDRRRFEVRAGCLRRVGRGLTALERSGLPMDTYPGARPAGPARLWAQARLAWRLARQGVQVLNTATHESAALALPAARWARTPVVVTSVYHWPPSAASTNVDGRPLADRLIVGTQALRRVLVEDGIPADRVVVIRPGIDPAVAAEVGPRESIRRQLGLASRTPLIACVSRIATAKGLDGAIRAMATVGRRHDAARLLVVGDGFIDREGQITPDSPHMAALWTAAREAGVLDRVIFTGHRDDVPALLSQVDISVVPTPEPRMPRVLLESMAAGRPVVVAEGGGAAEGVTDGETGRLVPSADPEALATAITDLLDHPAYARALGAAGQRRVREAYSVAATAAATAELYHDLFQTSQRDGGRTHVVLGPADPHRPALAGHPQWERHDRHSS